MKRALCAALSIMLLGTSAASAHDWDRDGYRGHGDGAAVAVGLGILTLGIIAAESAHHRDRYHERGYYLDGGRNYYGNGYGDGYGYRDRYYGNGYGDNGYYNDNNGYYNDNNGYYGNDEYYDEDDN